MFAREKQGELTETAGANNAFLRKTEKNAAAFVYFCKNGCKNLQKIV